MQFWDSNSGTLMSTLSQHTEAVLTLTASPDECKVFASGVDSRVTCAQRLTSYRNSGDASARQPSDHQRVHLTAHRPRSHDVQALAMCPGAGGLLLSGGLDAKLCVYSVADFVHTRPQWVSPIPARGLVSHSQDNSTGMTDSTLD